MFGWSIRTSGESGRVAAGDGGGKYSVVPQDHETGHLMNQPKHKLHHFGLCGIDDTRLTRSMRIHRILLLFVYPVLLAVLVIAGFYVSINEHTTCLPVSHYSVVQTNFSSLLGEALGQTVTTTSSAPTPSPASGGSTTTSSPVSTSSSSSSAGAMADEAYGDDSTTTSSGSSNDGSLSSSALGTEYSEEYSLKPGQVILGSETVPDYYESLEDKLMTLLPTVEQTSAPTLFPTASPTTPTAPTVPTVEPTLSPTLVGEDSGASGEDEDTYSEVGDGKVSRWTYDDIVARTGDFTGGTTDYQTMFWQGDLKLVQPNDDGYVYLALSQLGTKVSSTSFTECVLEDTMGTGSMAVPCEYVKSPVAAVRMNATEAIEHRKLNVWNVYVSNSLLVSELMFGKIIMCVGQRNTGMPVKYDLAATGFVAKHDARIHSYRMAYQYTANDVSAHSWDNTESNLPEISAECYATAVAYLDRFPNAGYIGAMTSTSPDTSFKHFIPDWVNSNSNDRGYNRGLSQVRFNGIEILLVHAYEAMLAVANMNNHIDVLFPQFFKTYLQATHPNTKVALVGAHLISTSMEALMVQTNELMRNYVDVSLRAYGLSATFVSTYDLEDPYFRVDQTVVHTSDGCADDDETVWPWFLNGWCENQESNRIFDKVGMPRLKGPIGYRGVVQLYQNATSSQDASFYLAPSFTSFTVENDRSILVTFDRPVSFSNATFQPYEIPFRWAGVTSSAYYGYNSGGERIESSDVFVSEDGYVLNITRTDADYFSTAMKSAFYAQTVFTCCNNFDDYGTSSTDTEDLVCPPMNCGLNSLEDPYIPVDMFRTNA